MTLLEQLFAACKYLADPDDTDVYHENAAIMLDKYTLDRGLTKVSALHASFVVAFFERHSAAHRDVQELYVQYLYNQGRLRLFWYEKEDAAQEVSCRIDFCEPCAKWTKEFLLHWVTESIENDELKILTRMLATEKMRKLGILPQ